MKYTRLNSDEILIGMEKIKSHWNLVNDCLVFEKRFPNFSTAFAFLTEIAMISEKLNHHATITNKYGFVKLEILTHEVAGLTKSDFIFAESVNQLMDMRRNFF
jgi:4a-hydroxytetrahydrobiopterin dehydratase